MYRMNALYFAYLGDDLIELDGLYDDETGLLDEKSKGRASELFKKLAEASRAFGEQALGKMFDDLEKEPPLNFELMQFLSKQFTSTLRGKFVLLLRPGKDAYFSQEQLFGADVEKAFPSSVQEIRDAGNCIALGMNTAAVCHLMRALEPVLEVLGMQFGVDPKSNWQSALDDIEGAVRNRENPKNRPNWDDEKDFYINAVTHFFHVKNAWRNYTMHRRLRYNGDESLEIYNDVKRFMQKLSTKLHE